MRKFSPADTRVGVAAWRVTVRPAHGPGEASRTARPAAALP
jgi:hypothetical protein